MVLLFCLLLTVIVEGLFFRIAGPRDRDFLTVCVLINAITNLSLNLMLYLLVRVLALDAAGYYTAAGILELVVVAAEYLVYRNFLFRDRSLHPSLLIKTLLANILSCGTGILIEILAVGLM